MVEAPHFPYTLRLLCCRAFTNLVYHLSPHFHPQRYSSRDVTTQSSSHWCSLHVNLDVRNLSFSFDHYANFAVGQPLPRLAIDTTLYLFVFLIE